MNLIPSRLSSRHLIGVALLASLGHCEAAPQIVMQSSQVTLEMDPGSGAITRIKDVSSGVSLEAPQGLAENYRLILLTPDKKMLTILGKDQKLTGSGYDKGTLSLSWAGPLTDTAGAKHDLSVRMDVAALKGSLEFTLHVTNNTECKVQEAWYPLIGGLTDFHAPGQECDAVAWAPTTKQWEKPVKLPFDNVVLAYPSQMVMSFTCIQSKSLGKSLYFASHDPIARFKYYRFIESGAADGKDVFASIQHMPFTPPGKTFDGSSVALRFIDGDWHAAGQVYREWFKTAFGITQPSECWIRRESFTLFTMFMLPEGTVNYTFKDIPRWARAAKDHGINAVQVSGWQLGGHDNGYPDYTIDPHLGTWKDLEDGIRACHKMGMKVFFFVNYQPMMLDSDWYKNELHKYREMTASGGLTWNAGWGMGTLWARMGHPKLMTWADLSFPQFRKIIVDDFAKLAQIGADGVHVDKMFPTAIDYNPDIPASPDTATWEGAITLTKEIMAACRKYNPEWAMSFECNWDRMMQFTGSTWWVGNQLITRQIFPENAETLAITQAYDYLGINNAVRSGHQVMVTPMNFSRGIEWAPVQGLADYIKEVKQIRDGLQGTVWYGEILGQTGVKLENQAEGGIDYNVFLDRDTGRRVCIFTNSGRTPRKVSFLGFDGRASNVARVHTPFTKSRVVSLPAAVEIPGERIVFVEEAEPGTAPTRATAASSAAPIPPPAKGPVTNGDFETGTFEGWTADPNWVVVDNSCGYYAGWQGKYWAWSGGKGEAAVGVLTSKPFVLDKNAVRLLISGWDSISGSGSPRKWNYVTLNLEDGTEIDRVYAPNTVQFVPAYLDGSRHRGKRVYVQAVDEADQPAYSMLCIDDVRTSDLPVEQVTPLPPLPAFDPKKSIKLEDDSILVEVNRANGSVTRIRDKKSGLDLILEPRLAGSYKFALPIPGKEPWQTLEANWVIGRQQKLSSHQIDGDTLTLRWNGPLSNYLGAKFDISVLETIKLTGGGAQFSLHIENPGPYPVGETYFPLIGGIQGLGTTTAQLKTTQLIRPAKGDASASKPTGNAIAIDAAAPKDPEPVKGRSTLNSSKDEAPLRYIKSDIFRLFSNASPFGDQGPEQYYAYPETQPEPWVGFSNPKLERSVCIGARDPANRNLAVHLELSPGNSGTPREDGNWPRPEELNGLPVGVTLSFVDFANFPPGKPYDAAPVFLRFLDGGGPQMRKAQAK